MNEDYANFPFDDVLEDMLEESKIKRFRRKVAEKKGGVNAEDRHT